MKTIGLIGGMSWESTITYYEVLNKEIVRALGGFHSAKILMYSVDFAELEANMSKGDWDGNAMILADAAKRLERAGADFIVIATNTMHKLVPQIEREIQIPILHTVKQLTMVVQFQFGVQMPTLPKTCLTTVQPLCIMEDQFS